MAVLYQVIMKGKTGKVLIISASAIVVWVSVVFFNIAPSSGPFKDESLSNYVKKSLSERVATCSILADSKINTGTPALNFTLDLLHKFTGQCGLRLDIEITKPSKEQWENLINKKTDLIICSVEDTNLPKFAEYIEASLEIKDGYVGVVRFDDEPLLQGFNYWLAHYKPTGEYQQLLSKLHKKENRQRYCTPITRHLISPYDDLVKKYASLIGWDWRLLSALMYRESKFNMEVISRRGAVGLMQIMEATAEKYKVTDIYDPEQNIKAGVMLLSMLQKMYKRLGIEEPELHKIVLGAYNAGQGNMEQLMQEAENQGKNPHIWDTLISVLPLSSFKGNEMISHVALVEEQYDLYRRTVVE